MQRKIEGKSALVEPMNEATLTIRRDVAIPGGDRAAQGRDTERVSDQQCPQSDDLDSRA